MNTVYDLLLNFQDEAFAFYEWDQKDSIDHIKKIPMVRVSSEMLFHLLNYKVSIDDAFLQEINKLTEKYDLEKIDYACLFTDGNIVLAVEFNQNGESTYKSRLLLEDEEEITKYASHEEEINILYHVINLEKTSDFFTRKEKKVKHFLEREIVNSYDKKEYSKLRYLYLEYFNAFQKDSKKIKEELLNSMADTLNKKHFQLYELLLLPTKKKVK